jgi:hypothetical protein
MLQSRMRTLAHAAQSYLEAGGLLLIRAEPGFLEFARPEADASSRRIVIWYDDETHPCSSELDAAQRAKRETAETALLGRFKSEMSRVAGTIGFYLVASRLGYSQQFVTEATRVLGTPGGIRVPAEFFDAPYKIEGVDARRARSALGNVLALAGKQRRVAQPFSLRTGAPPALSARASGDLVEHLEAAVRDPGRKPKLRIIDGAAGSGKTIAFNALTAAVYHEFLAAKRARIERARPIVFLPEHLRARGIGYVDDIIAAVGETDVAELTAPEQFKWLLRNGHAIWMFDGLDEFYAGGRDFFAFVEEALNAPGSRAQFIICTRDSLLGSNPVVREFVERQLAAGDTTEVYELTPWSADAWRQLAWLELENGREGALNTPRVEKFVSSLERSSEIAAMARLPFYCSVLLARFSQKGELPRDELDVLELLVESMVRREHGKRVFRWQDFVDTEAFTQVLEDEARRADLPVPDGNELRAAIDRLLDEQAPELLFELIGGLAHTMRNSAGAFGGGLGLCADDTRDLIDIGRVAASHDSEVLRRLRISLVRFAFFGPGRRAGSLDFTHEILAEYFAARHALCMVERAVGGEATESVRSAFAGAVGAADIAPGSLFHRHFARQLARDPALRQALEPLLKSGDVGGANVRSFLALLLRGDADRFEARPPPLLPQHPAMAAS